MPADEKHADAGQNGNGAFGQIVSCSSQGVVFLDRAGVVRFANRAAAEIFGCSVEALLGRGSHLPLGCQAGQEIVIPAGDGHTRVLRSRCIPLDWDGVPGTVHYLDDITEHKRAQELLQKSEQQLADAQRVAHLGSWECDLVSGKVHWSEETYRIFQMPKEVQPSDQAFLGRVHLDDRERVTRAVEELVSTGAPVRNLAYRIVLPDGSIRLLLGAGEVVRDGSGRPVSLVGTCHDVTDSKLAQEALSESEQRFCKIFHAAPALVSITTLAEGTHLEVNETFLKTLGYERGEVIGRSALELDLWENPAQFQEVVETLLSKGSVRDREVAWRGKSGRLTGLLSAEIIEVGGKTFMVTLVSDLTQRKKMQVEQSRLAAIVQSSDDAIIGTTLGSIIIDWNRGAELMFGYSAAEALGRDVRMLLPPGHRDLVAPILEKIKRGERTEHFESETVTKDGRQLQVSSCISPIFDTDGGIIGAAAIIRDISDQKQAQKEIEILLGRLASRGAELEEVIPELEAFNYTVSHDLRTPLTVVNGYCMAIEMECGNSLPEGCHRYLEEIKGAALRMKELIDTMLHFSRLAKVELKRESVDLSELAQEVAGKLQMVEPQRGVRCEIVPGIKAHGDRTLLRMVLENLLSNAWRSTAEREDALIEVGSTKVEGEIAYYVRDNGKGFDQAQAGDLFLPFRQLSGGDSQKGFGVGLATVQRIVKRHGGMVWAEGEPGKGATFYFTL